MPEASSRTVYLTVVPGSEASAEEAAEESHKDRADCDQYAHDTQLREVPDGR